MWTKEQQKAYHAAWYLRNRDRLKSRYAQNLKRWRQENPEKVRDQYLRRFYKTTAAWRAATIAEQNGCCAVCQEPLPENTRHVHVDHCHTTGALRGVLCRGCNHGLGGFRDNPEYLRRAIDYLHKHKKEVAPEGATQEPKNEL